jgi:hypothetical protein
MVDARTALSQESSRRSHHRSAEAGVAESRWLLHLPDGGRKNVEYIAGEDGLNGADASCGQPTNMPPRVDAIAFAELVCEVCHSVPLTLRYSPTLHRRLCSAPQGASPRDGVSASTDEIHRAVIPMENFVAEYG